MPFLRDMSDRVWDYISPRKTQKRRDKPFKVPALPPRAKSPEGASSSPEVTPLSKIGLWAPKTPASSSFIDETLLPPSPPTSLHRGVEELDLDFDGDTLIHDSVEDLTKAEAADAWDANDGTMLVDDGQYMELQKPRNPISERVQQEIQHRDLRLAGWSEDAIFLFQKLNMRGFEPIFSTSWENDFVTLPLDLFTANENKVFIKADQLSDFRAQHALHQLFTVGGLARDAVLTRAPKRTAEYHIARAVKNYSRWAMMDGGMRHTHQGLRLFDTVACNKDMETYLCEQKMIRKLHKLHLQWEQDFATFDNTGIVAAPEELPTLYGVITSHTVMAFVSYVLPTDANPKGSLRTIAIFNFGDEGHDVWNSLAIAVFVIHCRNRMQQLKEFLPEPVVVHERDPDL